MPLYLTAAHSSRVSKPAQRSANTSRRHSASPFANIPRTKASVSRTKSLSDALDAAGVDDDDDDDDEDEQRLVPTGKVLSTVSIDSAKDVLSAIQHARSSMFAPLPERAGMNSVRIAEVLNFQRNLPAIVSLAHVHAIISASSKTERQIAALQSAGKLRKIKVIGRGNDISGTSDVLISFRELQVLLERSNIEPEMVAGFCDVLRRQPRATAITPQDLPPSYVTTLTRTGFLVSSSMSGSRNISLAGSSLVAMPKISRAASGTSDAVGGDAAFENLGGTGGAKRPGSGNRAFQGSDFALSVPNLGPYLRLLNAGRAHLLELLGKSKYKEAPLYLLRERWDGAVDSDNRISTAKRIRGEFSGVLPAKTKKWKDLYGLNFDWVVEECVGAGLIELFETQSVGLGIRALT
ncbi:hypothetical protein LTR93_008309 [Exophiala xenobiotica]|nr:hypothetical protein LTR93_008309 [Exophiala xenobiotica]KAK5405020.1 hypothetical protein LTR06_009287 [Exophiala xenobiotica]